MVVFFDIDGTIIDDQTHLIPESAVRAVEQLRRNGHIAIVNTGRPFLQVDPRVKQMAFRGFACGCGMEVLLDGAWLVRAKPSLTLRQKALACSRKYGMCSFYETEDGGILLDGDNSRHPIMSREVERLRAAGFPIHELANPKEPDFVKFVTFSGEASDVEGFKAELQEDFTIIDRENFMLELVLKGYSKAGGMQVILDHLHTSKEDTLAIGDSTNDLPMFRLAAHTVCLGGGMDEVKAISEYVTARVMDDGVEKALKHYGLI